jgi:hypothetical protein
LLRCLRFKLYFDTAYPWISRFTTLLFPTAADGGGGDRCFISAAGKAVAQVAWTLAEDTYRRPLGRLVSARPLALALIYIAMSMLDIESPPDFAEVTYYVQVNNILHN